MNEDYPRYLSYKMAMNYIGIKSYVTIHKMIDQGLPVIIMDGVKKIDRFEVDKFLASKAV
ncbi:DNA-binding protein [Paucilactobacillus nenjiangensis]|uniref:DNA-binding protein n=1 Tax=Paucilactobacillus nenjiangensis TaxID=1296540 RepID=UPI0028D0C18A|nr:DNA-binding protein [Paucilactobacillus nenjiangensis]